jgi:chromosomal replication initiation ATPase DnaA
MEDAAMNIGHRHQANRALKARSRYRLDRLRRDAVAYALVERIAKLRRTGLRDLLQGSRGIDNAAHTRQIAMYLVHVVLGRPQDVVGLLFDRERTTVSHACAAVELLRDADPVLDAELALIEAEGWSTLAVQEVRDVA